MNQRYLARVAATFLARSQSTAFLTDYVTSSSVFVRTDSPPHAMELLRIEFTLPPDSTKVVLHGMVTHQIAPSTKQSAPGVEIAFFAKGGDASRRWDRFIAYLSESYPESLGRPVMLAEGATDQVRRAHPRLVPQSAIQLGGQIGGKRADSLTVANISDGGMFIRTEDIFLVGSDLRVTLEDPHTLQRIPVDCVVRRRASGSNAGIGVEFRNMDDAHRHVLRELIHAAAGAAHPVQAHCEEILAPAAPRMMTTLVGPGSFGIEASTLPASPARGGSGANLQGSLYAEDSWAGLDEGYRSP